MKIGVCATPDNLRSCCVPNVDFTEISIKDLADKSDSQIDELLKISRDCAVPIETANCFFPSDIRLCGDGYSKENISEYSKSILDKGARLGIKLAVIGSGKAREIPAGEDEAKCRAQFEECLFTISDAASGYGISIVLEPLNKKETNLINTVAEGGEIVKKLACPNIFLIADIYHMAVEEEPYENIVKYKDIIRHMHIARGITRKFPTPDDGFDYNAVKKAVDEADYNLRLSIEGGPYEDFDKEIGGCVNFVKDIFGR